MSKKEQYLWFGLFALGTIAYTVVQDSIRPTSAGYPELAKYLLGVAPNYFAGICLPSFFMAMIAQIILESAKRGKASERQMALSFSRVRMISLGISVSGLLIWEAIQIQSKSARFDPHDILWTLFGAATFELLYRLIHKPDVRKQAIAQLSVT